MSAKLLRTKTITRNDVNIPPRKLKASTNIEKVIKTLKSLNSQSAKVDN